MTTAPADDNTRLRWGILSTARISADVIPGLQRSQQNRLVAVASRNLANAQTFADANAIPTAFGSYEALLEDPSIDCVYIPLPNHLHAEWTHRALLAGKHVLCEKPFVYLVSVNQVLDHNGIDERSYGMLHYADDVVATIDCSMRSHSGYGVTVVGSDATATLACPWYSHKPPAHLEVVSASGEQHILPDGPENPYFLETENFAYVVTGRAEPEIDADETVRTVRTLARLQQSAVTRSVRTAASHH